MVTNPCDPNPCKSGFLCSINHLCRHGDLACSHYICQPGCSVGDGPSLLYPRGSRIRVPVELLSTEDGELHLGYSTCNTVYMLCTCFQGSHVFRCILSLFTLYLLSNVFLFPCTYTSSLLLNEPCSFSSFYPSSLHTSVGSRRHICLYVRLFRLLQLHDSSPWRERGGECTRDQPTTSHHTLRTAAALSQRPR